MEERVTTSFIPKASLQTAEIRHPQGSPVALANLVCGILLVLSIVGAGGMYFFEQYTNSQITAKQQSLAVSREAFQPSTIEELSRLDVRIEAGKALLAQHISVSKLFDELERVTLASVRYDSFDYSVAAPGHVVITMKGEATSFNAVAVQSEAFAKSSLITDPLFSNVNVGKAGAISFDFTAVVDASRMIYTPSSTFGATSTPQQILPPPQQQTPKQ